MQEILRDLFQQGSLTGLQVAGSLAEYYVRVGIQSDEKKMFKHSLSGGGHSARCSQACGDLGQGGATLSLKDGAIKITEPPNMLV